MSKYLSLTLFILLAQGPVNNRQDNVVAVSDSTRDDTCRQVILFYYPLHTIIIIIIIITIILYIIYRTCSICCIKIILKCFDKILYNTQ